jgi:hypothetical protein
MRSLLSRLRRKLLGETWTIPLGVAGALVLALLLRALLPSNEWQTVGGFVLAVLLIATLIRSLPLKHHRKLDPAALTRAQQPNNTNKE